MAAQTVAPGAREQVRWTLDFDLIERRLAELGVEPDGLAAFAGIDESTVFRIKKRGQTPSIPTVMSLYERLGVMPHLLVVRAES